MSNGKCVTGGLKPEYIRKTFISCSLWLALEIEIRNMGVVERVLVVRTDNDGADSRYNRQVT
jgi:hypothetical protein